MKSREILNQIAYNSDLKYSALQKNEPNPDITYNALHKNQPDPDFMYNAFTKNHPEFSNMERDRTTDIIYGANNYKIRYVRSKRSSVERSLESIRKRLNEERKKERDDQLMAADAYPRMEVNETTGGVKHVPASFEYGEFIFLIASFKPESFLILLSHSQARRRLNK